MYYNTNYPSPVGNITLACNGDHLIGLWLEKQKYYGGSILEITQTKDDLPVFDAAKKWMEIS